MAQWFVLRDGGRRGPYSGAQIKEMAATGRISSEDIVETNTGQRLSAAKLKGLKAARRTEPGQTKTSVLVDASAQKAALSAVVENNRSQPIPPQPTVRTASQETHNSKMPDGLDIAKTAFKHGTAKLRTSFGAAFADTLNVGRIAMGDLLRHPFKFSVAFVMLQLACGFAALGLITIILVPVFVLGYIRFTHSLLNNDSPSYSEFIWFMRHGWDSLWHLLMLLACFIVTIALMIAPVIITSIILYVTFGTLGTGIAQVAILAPTSERSAAYDTSDFREHDNEGGIWAASEGDGILASLVEAVSAFGEFVVRLVGLLIGFLIVNVFLAPLSAAMILIYTLTLGISEVSPRSEARFDLVYDSFIKTLRTGKLHWRRLVCGGLMLSLLLTATVGVIAIVGEVLLEAGLPLLGLWMWGGVFHAALFIFVNYVSVFCLRSSLSLRDAMISSDIPAAG